MNKIKIVTVRVLLLAIALLFRAAIPYAQMASKIFSKSEGLPSNLIYSFIQDKKGFLWISTDNGVARFDGKYFRIYNTKDGLPDNEVLEILAEDDGTIWANTFKQGPVYFDEKADRFVDPLKGINVDRSFVNLVMYVRKLANGGIVFFNSSGEFVFQNQKLVKTSVPRAFSYPGINKNLITLKVSDFYNRGKRDFFVHCTNGSRRDSMLLFSASPGSDLINLAFLDSSRLFVIGDYNTIYGVMKPEAAEAGFKIDSVILPEKPVFFRVTQDYVNVTTISGKIFVFDKRTFSRRYVLEDKNIFYNCIYEDSEKNIWAGTANSNIGMMLYKLNHIQRLNITGNLADPGFMSVMAAKNGKLYAGNYFGQIVESSGNQLKTYSTLNNERLTRVRKLVDLQNKIFWFSEEASYVNFKRKLMFEGHPMVRLKCAREFNDSIIIAGGVSSAGGLYKINAITEKVTRLRCNLLRISTLAVAEKRYIYLGTNDGLYKYDYLLDSTYPVLANAQLGTQRILSIGATPDGLICVATPADGVYILKNDKVIFRLENSILSGNAINCITATPNRQIWLGSRGGLSRVSYGPGTNWHRPHIENFTEVDGLPSEDINDIAWRNDSIFVATAKGVAYVPAKLEIDVKPITTYLTHISVNNKTILLRDDNTYTLDHDQRSIMLEFSGVSLSGRLKKLQYTSDSTKGWIDIDADDLSLELGTGYHDLFIRAVDNNGSDVGPVLPFHFIIQAPVYRRLWFIILAAALTAGLITLLILRMRTSRQRRELQQQLRIEQERSRITADLHDDIGSTLSSLQIYSDIAYNIIDRDKEKAKGLMARVSAGASKISENIGDIIWSMKANQQYSLSPTSRIKNIVSEVLGPTGIDYEINLEESLDKKITCITCRKNLILVVKEAVNNIAKYSHASRVWVELKSFDKYYVLTVKDNGIGMNLEEKQHTGNGLGNMKKRVEEVGGELKIVTSPGKGTEISSLIPILRATGQISGDVVPKNSGRES